MRTEHFFIHAKKPSTMLLLANCIVTFIYFMWWFDTSHIGNIWLYTLLFLGEAYHVGMSYLFWYTIWPLKRTGRRKLTSQTYQPSVDIFITVASEPIDIIENTVIAARDQNYENKRVFILNDGYVAKRPDWMQIVELAQQLGVQCITRRNPGGAKAGNINHALSMTNGEIVVIFDADMIPFPHFLTTIVPYFTNTQLGFVQTPQYYKNHAKNDITSAAWEQQELFYGPIMRGKDTYNSAFICGTNVAIRRSALENVGGLLENTVTEDFLTSIYIHQNGYQSIYIPEVLAIGLAPEDLLSYYKQQRRWARGSLDALFVHNPIFKRGLTFHQKMQYLSSALYYLNGLIILIDIAMPVIYLFTGIKPVTSSTFNFAIFFIPFIFLNLLTLYTATGKQITFRALAFSQSSFMLQLSALFSLLLWEKDAFAITSKQALAGNFKYLAYPHMLYIFIVIISTFIALYREGINPSIVTNIAWAVFNSIMFYPFIKASFNPQEKASSYQQKPVTKHIPTISNI